MVALLSLLAYLLYALWVGRRSLAVAGKQTSSVNDVIHYECMIIELSRYGKFPEFFRKNSGKFPTFYFSGKVTTLTLAAEYTSCVSYSVCVTNGDWGVIFGEFVTFLCLKRIEKVHVLRVGLDFHDYQLAFFKLKEAWQWTFMTAFHFIGISKAIWQ